MVIRGRVQNGVVVLNGQTTLPEGSEVAVTYPAAPAVESGQKTHRVDFPLVRSKHPGSVQLTAEHVAALLENDDVSA
jgi:hypothetical protein